MLKRRAKGAVLPDGLVAALAERGFAVVEHHEDRAQQRFQLVVHKAGGVTHRDCAAASRATLDWYAAQGTDLAEHYLFEVCSPGLGRKLKYADELDVFRGERVVLTVRDAEDRTRELEGRSAGLTETGVRLALDDGTETEIGRDDVLVARLAG